MTIRTGLNNKKGFTLSEVIISVAVLCIVCVVILQLFVSADDLRERNLIREQAQIEAVNKMEEIKTLNVPTVPGLVTEPDYDGSFTFTQYFDEEWNWVESGDSPTFIISTNLKPPENTIFTQTSFGTDEVSYDVYSAIFEISIKVIEVESGEELAMVNSAEYYRNIGVGNE